MRTHQRTLPDTETGHGEPPRYAGAGFAGAGSGERLVAGWCWSSHSMQQLLALPSLVPAKAIVGTRTDADEKAGADAGVGADTDADADTGAKTY